MGAAASKSQNLRAACSKALLGGVVGCTTFWAYAFAYRQVYGRHQMQVCAEFALPLDADKSFQLVADPILLNATTPWWFDIRLLDHDGGVARRNLAANVVEVGSNMATVASTVAATSTGAARGSNSRTQPECRIFRAELHEKMTQHSGTPSATEITGRVKFPRQHYLNYHISCFRLPSFPWTSELCVGLVPDGSTQADTFGALLSYRQHRSLPYHKFEHSHEVFQSSTGAKVVDVITADFLGEPLLNRVCGVLLEQLLRSRADGLWRRAFEQEATGPRYTGADAM